MPQENYSFRHYSDLVSIFYTGARIAYPDVIHMRQPVFSYMAEKPSFIVADCSALEYIDQLGARFLLEMQAFQAKSGFALVLSNILPGPHLDVIRSIDPDGALVYFGSNSEAAGFMIRFSMH